VIAAERHGVAKMVSVGTSNLGSGSSLALDARVAVGAGVFAAGRADSTAAVTAAPSVTPAGQKIPAYIAVEFVYRQDYGKIIMLERNAETGQEITQVPSEYHLQQYAASQRAVRAHLQEQQYLGSSGGGQPRPGASSAGTTKQSAGTVVAAKGSPVAVAQPTAPAPVQSAAPALTVATPAHVDIKV
jgi:hypothetical protein